MIRVLKIRTEVCFRRSIEDEPETYSIFKEDNGEYFFRHWKTGSDEKRRSKKYSVCRGEIEPLLEKLYRLNVPVFSEPRDGCDGGYTELEIGGYGGKSCFRWWSVPPVGWEPLDKIVDHILNLMTENE